MAPIQPFHAITFDPLKVGPLDDVLCPPYDVIAPKDQADLYERNPCNIVRLELGKDLPEDSGTANRYTRAHDQLSAWLTAGVLRREPDPALYLYEQAWADKRRLSLFAAVRLAPWSAGEVLPHEQTLAGPKKDRLELMRHTGANLSPIMGLYDDPSGAIAARLDEIRATPPHFSAATGGSGTAADKIIGDRHAVWKIGDGDRLNALQEALSAGPIFIADGHHRYETALAYQRERQESQASHTGKEPWNYVLMALTSLQDPGLVVLPTHRMVRVPGFDPAPFLDRLSRQLALERLALGTAADLAATLATEHWQNSIGMVLAGDETLYRLSLAAAPETALAPLGHSKHWCELSVAQLHYLILADLLGIPERDWEGGDRIAYTREPTEALAALHSGDFEIAFFLSATRVEQIQNVSLAGEVLPQKSTYFFPKLPTGLIIHPLDHAGAEAVRP